MGLAVIEVSGLPDSSLDAAATFHDQWLPKVRSTLGDTEELAIILPAADYRHTGWRKAMVQEIALESAPKRVNMVAGAAGPALEQSLAYLRGAPGVTGQYLVLYDDG